MKTLLGIVLLGGIALSSASFAADDHHEKSEIEAFKAEAAEARDDHYHVAPPKSVLEAKELLEETAKKVELHHRNGEFEELHKDSYALEAVVDSLRLQDTANEKLIDELDEVVQIIHYASEQENKKILDQEMGAFKNISMKVIDAL